MLLRIWLLGSFLLVAPVAWAQEKTFLAPTPVLDGEDAALRKSLYGAWDKLPRELKVSGAVVNGAGKPVSNAKLTVQLDIGVELEGRADEEGKFYFEAPATGLCFVTARSEDGALLAVGMSKGSSTEGILSLHLIAQPTKEVTLQVRSKAGDPIAGAYFGATLGGMVIARGKCDAEGRFTVQASESIASEYDDERREVVQFYAMAEGFGLNVVQGENFETGFKFPEELILPLAKPITVKVTDRDGKPLAGLPVYLPRFGVQKAEPGGGMNTVYRYVPLPISLDARSFVTSNAQGDATIGWFIAPKAGASINGFPLGGQRTPAIPVYAIHPEWKTGWGTITIDGEKIDASCTVYSPSVIRGRVFLPSGEPAAGIVLGSQKGDLHRRRITTDALGKFELTATSFDSGMMVIDPKWVSDWIELSNLVRKASENDIELKLREGKRVKVRVTAGAQYAPLKDHLVTLYGASGTVSLTTDKEGRAEATVDRGIYRVEAMSNAISKQLRTPRPRNEITVLVKDLPEVEIPVHFEIAEPRVIKVTVLKTDGVTPMEKAKVEILNPFQADAKTETQMQDVPAAFGGANALRMREIERQVPVAVTVSTDSAGKAELRAPVDAPAMLMVSSEDGARAIASVDILEDAATVTLRKTVGVKGKLVDEASGEPIVGSEMEIRLEVSKMLPNRRAVARSSDVNRREAPTQKVTTDEEGNFEFKELIGDAEYAMHVLAPSTPFGAARPAVRPPLVQLKDSAERSVRTQAEGITDLGELKAMVYRPPVNPPRAVPFRNPGVVPAPR